MIYVIFGASGSGKSTLLNIVRNDLGHASAHVKGTTRNKRQYDEEEIVSFPDGLPEEKYQYIYSQYGYEYGIEKAQLDHAIANKIHHFVICNDLEIIQRLRRDYSDCIKVIFLRFDAPMESLEMIQRSRNITDDEIDVRINKIKLLHSLFIEQSDLFDEVIVNRFGNHPERNLRQQLYRIINEETTSLPNLSIIKETINYLMECVRRHERMVIANPAPQKGFLFVIMGMMEGEDSLQDIHYAIINAARNAGYKAERADDKFKFMQINDKILNYINMAEVIVADLTFERPNCYYEVGYAHAKGKKVVLTARRGTKIHFDVSNFQVVMYDTVSELDRKLSNILRGVFAENKE